MYFVALPRFYAHVDLSLYVVLKMPFCDIFVSDTLLNLMELYFLKEYGNLLFLFRKQE